MGNGSRISGVNWETLTGWKPIPRTFAGLYRQTARRVGGLTRRLQWPAPGAQMGEVGCPTGRKKASSGCHLGHIPITIKRSLAGAGGGGWWLRHATFSYPAGVTGRKRPSPAPWLGAVQRWLRRRERTALKGVRLLFFRSVAPCVVLRHPRRVVHVALLYLLVAALPR